MTPLREDLLCYLHTVHNVIIIIETDTSQTFCRSWLGYLISARAYIECLVKLHVSQAIVSDDDRRSITSLGHESVSASCRADDEISYKWLHKNEIMRACNNVSLRPDPNPTQCTVDQAFEPIEDVSRVIRTSVLTG
jgi:hypothetical protein